MKKVFPLIIGIILLAGLGLWLWFNQPMNTPLPPTTTTTPPVVTQQIIIDVPQSGATIASPLLVSGKARGTWYFEASFPVRVEDANGVMLGQAPVTAQGDWMTTEFVPFIGSISFATSTTINGFVVFAKDNPSGLPQNDAEVRVPVTFSVIAPVATTSIKVYFQNERKLMPGQDICTTVASVTRIVTSTPTIGTTTLEELLKGPTETERAVGYTTSLPTGVKLNRLTITDGVALADFSAELDRGIGGSCRVTAIRKQLTETLRQFPTVTSAVLAINGETETILQP